MPEVVTIANNDSPKIATSKVIIFLFAINNRNYNILYTSVIKLIQGIFYWL